MRLVHEVDVEAPACLLFDPAMTLEARAFKWRFGPLLCESSEAALFKCPVDHVVACVEQCKAVLDVVRTHASIDELNV